jgi:hypothetical protein
MKGTDVSEGGTNMKPLRIIGIVLTFILMVFAVSPGLKAQTWNKRTVMTFAAPFEIPGGKTLPAGTYVFKLYDSMANRHIVQIFDRNESKIYATILAISDYRVKRTTDTVVTFEERATGTPVAIKEWFYPDNQFGQQFVYPKARAAELAKLTNEPVPSAELPVTPAEQAPLVTLQQAPITVQKPSGEETTVAEAFPPPPPETHSLPKTASEMPLLGMIGLLSIAAGFALRLAVKRVS